MATSITVNKYLSEASDDLIKIVDAAIVNNKKLHIGAPVGTGKTTFAIDVVEHLGNNYKVLFLFPIIAISEQAQVEFKNRKIDAEIFNSKVNISDVKDCQVILTTIDSAYKLLEDGFLDDEKVLIILDETHTYLQNARTNFSLSVEAILNSGFPIIGLSATPSKWVNTYLFEIDKYLDVKVTSYKAKTINPVEVGKSLIRYVAGVVSKKQDDKWIIFLERKKLQKQLKQLIQEKRPNSKIVVLNYNTKKKKEKETWNHLMNKGDIPDKVDVAIINSVAQAGINIKNKDIDHVILVDKHDPFGVAQFIGRCRNYAGDFDFYFSPGGLNLIKKINTETIQERLDKINKLLDYKNSNFHKNLKELVEFMGGGDIRIDASGSLVADKCNVATKLYELLRNVPGKILVSDLAALFPNDISVHEVSEVKGITGTTTDQIKVKRDKARRKLVNLVAKNTSLVLGFDRYIDENTTDDDAREILDHAAKNLFEAFVTNKPWYKRKKDKKTIRQIIKYAEKSERTIQRVAMAASLYIQSGNKKSVLRTYLQSGERRIKKLYSTKVFFENKIHKNEIVEDAISDLEGMVGEMNTTPEWNKIIRSLVSDAENVDDLVDLILFGCMNMKYKEDFSSGKRIRKRELISVNRSFAEFLDNNKTLKDFINSTP